MAQQVQSDPKHKKGTVFLKASALQLQGNWKKHATYIELQESSMFKVSGECELKGGSEDEPYVGQLVVGLAEHHNMGKVKTEKSPPLEESQEDFTNRSTGTIIPIALGHCDDEYVKFSLTGAEPYWKMQKGLIIYGVVFNPLIWNPINM